MTEKIPTTAEILQDVISKFETIAETHGPAAVDLGLYAIRFSGIFELVVCGIGFILLIIMYSKFLRYIKNTCDIDDKPFAFAGATLLLVIGLIPIMGIGLLNKYSWAAALYPELYIALRVINSI